MDSEKQGPGSKANKRQFLVRIDDGLIRRIKILAIDTHTTASVVVEQAIVAYFDSRPATLQTQDDQP